MADLANNFGTRVSHVSQGLPGSSDAEPVIVTPRKASGEFGRASIRDRVFAARCEFSWRSEMVSTPSGDGKRPLVFKRLKQTGSFNRDALHTHMPQKGDRITRSWDGATFEIVALYALSGRLLCDLVEINSHLQ